MIPLYISFCMYHFPVHVNYLQVLSVRNGETRIPSSLLTKLTPFSFTSTLSSHRSYPPKPKTTQSQFDHLEYGVSCLSLNVVYSRIVSQGVVCVHHVYLGSRLFFWVCLFYHPHGSTVYIILYVSFAYVTHDECPPFSFTRIPVLHSFSVTS